MIKPRFREVNKLQKVIEVDFELSSDYLKFTFDACNLVPSAYHFLNDMKGIPIYIPKLVSKELSWASH